MPGQSDVLENDIVSYDPALLPLLLIDRTRSNGSDIHNIIWATDNYAGKGEGYQEWDEISGEAISGENEMALRPRVDKSREEQERRSRDKAEVFTSAWICNKQNNLVDCTWFGVGESPFNVETESGWITKSNPISFPGDKSWQDYIKDIRLEMACGEAPYLVSRYNVITDEDITVEDRIGLLGRKLRVICENVTEEKEWFKWVIEAFRSIYGFEWQGDNLVLAREAMVYRGGTPFLYLCKCLHNVNSGVLPPDINCKSRYHNFRSRYSSMAFL